MNTINIRCGSGEALTKTAPKATEQRGNYGLQPRMQMTYADLWGDYAKTIPEKSQPGIKTVFKQFIAFKKRQMSDFVGVEFDAEYEALLDPFDDYLDRKGVNRKTRKEKLSRLGDVQDHWLTLLAAYALPKEFREVFTSAVENSGMSLVEVRRKAAEELAANGFSKMPV